jgi:hypothetical protein
MMKRFALVPLFVLLPTLCSAESVQFVGGHTSDAGYTAAASGTNSDITSLMGLTTPLAPVYGGVGTSTGAPFWARYYGDGRDGAGPASGTVGTAMYTTWHCTGAIVSGSNLGLYVRATGAVMLDTGCSISTGDVTTSIGNFGAAGGSGGSGAANSSAAANDFWGNLSNQANLSSGLVFSVGGAASSAGSGNAGSALTANPNRVEMMEMLGPPFDMTGGSPGSAGGSSGGAAGNGRASAIIIAPSITLASGVIIDVSGRHGTDPGATSKGAGGGGGAGVFWPITPSFTNNGAIYKYGGGAPGELTEPAIYVTGGGCDSGTNGCGTGARAVITGLTSGGLDASKITITGGSGYQAAPDCAIVAGASGLTGSPACHFTISAGAVASIVIDTAGTGGTLTTYATSQYIGGWGGNGLVWQGVPS